MKFNIFIMPLITGIILGVAQTTSRSFLLRKSLQEGFILGGITGVLYLVAIIQWIKVLKTPASLSGSYAVVVLGVFTGILTMSFLKFQENSHISPRNTWHSTHFYWKLVDQTITIV